MAKTFQSSKMKSLHLVLYPPDGCVCGLVSDHTVDVKASSGVFPEDAGTGAVRAAWPSLPGAPGLDGPASIGAIDLLASNNGHAFHAPR